MVDAASVLPEVVKKTSTVKGCVQSRPTGEIDKDEMFSSAAPIKRESSPQTATSVPVAAPSMGLNTLPQYLLMTEVGAVSQAPDLAGIWKKEIL